MNSDLAHAVLKEWYWGPIMLALILVAFAPSFLKSKCPKCKKRTMRSVEIRNPELEKIHQGDSETYTMFFRCESCGARFKRVRTAPLEDASDGQYDAVFDVAGGTA